MTTWRRFKIWNHWKLVSRVFGCTLMAMTSEAEHRVAVGKPEDKIRFKSGVSEFEVANSEYVSTLQSPHLFCGMALQAYCGLIEEHARDILRELDRIGVQVSSLLDTKYPTVEERIDHFPPPNGIEDWGSKILAIVNRSWGDVSPGRAKIVEVIVVRNALAHGTPEVTRRMLNRLENVGGTIPWKEGEQIQLNYGSVKDYRDHLRSFARVLSDATAEAINAHVATQEKAATSGRRQRNGT
ncbi:MAG: hypothetical protein WED34_21260 [Planctomycetales bacterium]